MAAAAAAAALAAALGAAWTTQHLLLGAAAAVVVTLLAQAAFTLSAQPAAGVKPPPPPPPPVVPGLPVLGSALDMARMGAQVFIAHCHKKYGDTFTLLLPPFGQRMTFILSPADARSILSDAYPESEVTFRPAVERFTQRVFCLPSGRFFPDMHAAMLKNMRSLLAPSGLQGYGEELGRRIVRELRSALFCKEDNSQQQQQQPAFDLVKTVHKALFAAAIDTLFGERFCQRHTREAVFANFTAFEKAFEVGASPIPHIFLPSFRRSRAWLLRALSASLSAGDFTSTSVETAVLTATHTTTSPSSLSAGALLATLWAAHANTLPAAFWTCAFVSLPRNKAWRDNIVGEIDERVKEGERELVDVCVGIALEGRKSALGRCVAEAVRLRASGIDVRIAASDVVIGSHTIPHGDVLALSPALAHVDPRMFGPDANDFRPDRWLSAETAALGPGVGFAFGGGKYRCPGRYFAEMEVALFTALMLYTYDVELIPKPNAGNNIGSDFASEVKAFLPPVDASRLVGVQHPAGTCLARIQKRRMNVLG